MGVAFSGQGVSAGEDIELAHIFVSASDDLTDSICLDKVDVESQEADHIKYRVTRTAHAI